LLRTKSIAGFGKGILSSVTEDMLVVLAEGLDMFRLGTNATGGNMNPVRQFVLYEKQFGWLDVWELHPEGLDHFG
jgi:hypothetical protein